MKYDGIDWVALGEAVVFVVACGVVGLVVAFLATSWYVAYTRRAMMRRYEQERKERVELPSIPKRWTPPPPAPPPTRKVGP